MNRFSYPRQWICLLILSLWLGRTPVHAQSLWQEMTTVAQVCEAYPARMNALLQSLNLEGEGLEPVNAAQGQGDLTAACTQLLAYYRTGNTARFLRRDLPAVSDERDSAADSVLRDIFTVQRVAGQSPRDKNGHIDWAFQGPQNDVEWAWGVNRHYPTLTLLDAYTATGNPRYARGADQLIKDWVISSLPYPGVKSSTAMWRGLEVSFRVKMWAQAFYQLMDSEALSPATRLLMLSSIPEHAHYARNFHAQGNWLTMEMSGLATAAAAWPEFRDAASWIAYSKEAMTESLAEQIYPDGVQTELTSHYHYVALRNFDQFKQILSEIDEPLPEVFARQIESMWGYLAYSMRPDGFGPMNNDSDRDYNRDRIRTAAAQYAHPDWQYIATGGEQGTRPSGPPSVVFPWAGHLIMRSDYDAQAHWAFFDMGPWGSGHQHNDKLHLSLSAYGRDLLVDGGRFAYRGAVADKFRGYALGSQSHNVVLIDGKGQAPGPKVADAPLDDGYYRIAEDFDYGWGDFAQFKELTGQAKHTRAVCYVRGKYWIVVDQIDTDRPREVQTLWHWHPNCVVDVQKGQVVATDHDHGNLRIVPVGKQKWEIDLVSGQETPEIQGWYSPEYNDYGPATASIYTTQIKKSATFAWLLVPSEGKVPTPAVKVLSRTDEAITLRIADAEGQWEVVVPLRNSAGAAVKEGSK